MIRKNDIVKHERLGKGKVVDLIRRDGIAVVEFEDTQKKGIVMLNQLQPTEEERDKRCIEHEIMLLENEIKHKQNKIKSLKQQLEKMEPTEVES